MAENIYTKLNVNPSGTYQAVLGNDAGLQAGNFTAGTINTIISGKTIAIDSTDGTRTADLCDNINAGTFANGTILTNLCTSKMSVYASDGTRYAQLVDSTEAGYFYDGLRSVAISNGSSCAYLTDSTYYLTLLYTGKYVISASDGTRSAYLCDNGLSYGAGYFTYGSVTVAAATKTIALDTTDGTRTADLCDGTYAGIFSNGGKTAKITYLCASTYAVYATDGTTNLTICDGTYAMTTGFNVALNADTAELLLGAGQDGGLIHNGSGIVLQSDKVTATDYLQLRGGTNGIDFNIGKTEQMTLTSALLSFTGGTNLAFATTTGTIIGTATDQLLSFWNKTPIIQPTTKTAEAAFTENAGGTVVNVDSTFGGYTLQQVVQALQNVGMLA